MSSSRLVSVLVVVAFACAPGCGHETAAPASQGPAVANAPAAAAASPSPAQSSSAPAVSAWKGFRPEGGPIVPGRAVSYASLSDSEKRYGVAPARGGSVVYQDQVVLIEHGDKVIKSVESNGMNWTLDASDPRVAALKEGDLVFATTDCVGRILKLTRTGTDVSVVLGPAQLTDLIKKGNFAYDAPLDLNALTAVADPDFPGTFGSTYFDQMKHAQAGGAGSGSEAPLVIEKASYYVISTTGVWRPMRTVDRHGNLVPARPASTVDSPSFVRASYSGGTQQLPNQTFNNVLSATPCFTDCGGLGIKLSANRAGLNVDIFVVLRLLAPKFTFDLSLGGPGPQAQIMLSGGVGFLMTVQGTTDPQFTSNLNETGAVPVDLTMPIQFGPLPLVLHYHQDLSLATAFSAKTSVLKARVDLKLEGSLGFFYEDGAFQTNHLSSYTNTDPAGEINGISMGINSIVAGISQRLLMGVGRGGFAAGPFVSLTTTGTALKQATEASRLMLPQAAIGGCTQATINMVVYGGIGYALPKIIVDAVNFFLKLIHVSPIAEDGTIAKFNEPFPVENEKYQLPKGCASAAGG